MKLQKTRKKKKKCGNSNRNFQANSALMINSPQGGSSSRLNPSSNSQQRLLELPCTDLRLYSCQGCKVKVKGHILFAPNCVIAMPLRSDAFSEALKFYVCIRSVTHLLA